MEMFKRQAKKVNIRNLSVTTGYAAILGSSSKKTQAAAHPHYPECSLFLCVFLYHPFSLLHHCRTSQLPRTLSFFFFPPRSVGFQPPQTVCFLLTRSSDCRAPLPHSSGGSWSCTRACPGSYCGCCALCSHWAPCRTGTVARIH